MKRVAGAMLVACLSSSCLYLHTIRTSNASPEYSNRAYGWGHHFLGGLITVGGDIDAATICPNGVAKVIDYVNFPNWLVGGITSGLYTPSSWEVFCVQKGALDEHPKTITFSLTPERLAALEKRYPNLISDLAVAKEDLATEKVATK